MDLTCFVREEDMYRKFSEKHRERGYHREEVLGLLEEAGFIPLAVFDAFSFDPPGQDSRRHFYAARRQ